MARRVRTLYPDLNDIQITPFGIDPEVFRPMPELRDNCYLTVGTVKTLEITYGIDILIRAFAQVKRRLDADRPGIGRRLRLCIVGGGSAKASLQKLASQLGIEAVVEFIGWGPLNSVPAELNRFDVYVAVSRCEESFGVAVLEASACAVPVIVSNRGGLPEVVVDGQTGKIVPSEDVEATADALLDLLSSEDRRKTIGNAGRRFVLDTYQWSASVDIMDSIYRRFLEEHPRAISLSPDRPVADHAHHA